MNNVDFGAHGQSVVFLGTPKRGGRLKEGEASECLEGYLHLTFLRMTAITSSNSG